MIKKRIKRIIIILVIAAISVISYFSLTKEKQIEYVTAKVERGKLIQTVSETGTLKAASEINLNFLNSGKIAQVFVNVGAKVKKDQILANLDYSSLLIKEREAKANLNKVLRGATVEEIAVSQASVNQTESAYLTAMAELEKVKNTVNENIAQAEKTLSDLESNSLNDITTYEQAVKLAQTSLDNTKDTYEQSIKNKENIILSTIESELVDADTALDTINTIISDDDAEDILSIKDITFLINTKDTRTEALLLSTSADSSLSLAKTDKTESNINSAIIDMRLLLDKTFESLNNCFSALENTIVTADFTQAELDAFKSSINTELTTISASISAVQTAEQNLEDARLAYNTNVSNANESLLKAQVDLDNAIITARNSLNTARISGDQQITIAQAKADNAREAREVAKAQLAQIKAPARPEDVTLFQTALDTVKKQIEDSIIKAPIDGTITVVNYEASEQTNAGEPVISMLGENNFEIEIDISEADIAKVNMGNLAEITLDAFGDDIGFGGKIYFIEPAETIIQDVIYYKVKIELTTSTAEFQAYSKNIKSGMTANAVITTAEKNNILIMPGRAIIQKNGSGKFTRVLSNGSITEVQITTGLRGDEGMVEVLTGVKEGYEVVTSIKE